MERMASDHPRRIADEARLRATLIQSIDRRLQRESIELKFGYDPELPITSHREEIFALLQKRQTLVVCGETGSGKSTQLPKICLEAGFGRRGMIGHTQPRRIAARSIAARLKEEMSESPTTLPIVGFKIRFNDATAPTTMVKLMTDGVLLAELARDRFLDSYEVIIIDEAHERSLNIDLLMAHLFRLRAKRPNLKIIITSATIDAERFAEYFADEQGHAPIIQVSGRTYPVEVRYLGNEAMPGRNEDRLQAAVESLLQESRGDILAFFPTERDIRAAHKTIQGGLNARGLGNRIEILPLYSRLSDAEQQKIFQPHKQRRIVLATNVAESSLTVPGIYSVIDTGTARIGRYAPRSKVQRLPVEPISQASANQRAGRCGRIGPGICIRLYDEADYAGRSPFTTPEIRRTDLASAILHTEMLKLGSLNDLHFIDPPRPEMIRDGIATLHEIGAMNDAGEITSIGRRLGRWPVGPRIGRMMIEAYQRDCLADVLIVASALEAQDVRLRPVEHQAAADSAHQKFIDPRSDFLSYLRLWDFYHRLKSELGRSRLERACRENFLSLPRIHEWIDLHRQLRSLVEESGWSVGPRRMETSIEPIQEIDSLPKGYDDLHQSMLVGLLSGIAYLDDQKRYKGVGGIELQLWPGSGVKQRKPKWIVASEIVETHQRYARNIAMIEQDWIEEAALHLLKRQHESPHFSRKAGAALIYEKASLFGLPIVARRPVPLAPIDPSAARRLLIDEGLVEKHLQTRAGFVQYNAKMLDEVQAWASKTRRRDLVVDPYFLQQHYDRTLPEEVVDRATLEKFDRSLTTPRTTHPVHLQWDQLVASFDREQAQQNFPEQLTLGPTELPIEYRFAPGAEEDGLTVRVPDRVAVGLSDDKLAWLVPGLLEEKVAQLIKTLPKSLRRNLVPAPAIAAKAMPMLTELRDKSSPFWPSLCQVLSKLGGEPVRREDFDTNKLETHLNIRVEVTNDKGEVVKASRELSSLKQSMPMVRREMVKADESTKLPPWFSEKWTDFRIDLLPAKLEVEQGGLRVERFVGLVDAGEYAKPELFDFIEHAEEAMKSGLVRLFVLADNRELRSQLQHLPGMSDASMKLSDRLTANDLRDGLRDLMARVAFLESNDSVSILRSKVEYESRRVDRIKRLSLAAAAMGTWLPRLTKSYHEMRLALPKPGAAWKANLEDVLRQLTRLFEPGFLRSTPWSSLSEYPRYLDAIKHRCSRWNAGGLAADSTKTSELVELQKDFEKRLSSEMQLAWFEPCTQPNDWSKLRAQKPSPPTLLPEDGATGESFKQPLGRLREYRWLMEEYRVSLFAQQLGTRVPISAKRLEKLREAI
jgi:ATP-dependent helicase HrpA